MFQHRILSIALIIWTVGLGQTTSLLALAELMHEAGHHSHVNSGSVEQHKNGQCHSQSLLHSCAISLLVSPPAQRVEANHLDISTAQTTLYSPLFSQGKSIRAPPVLFV
ncbi:MULTISPECIES: hypothetical protein [unclassified Agarivorans]|uniref:hypothetical protein n=1 Tax=unclassified Agarivorans TaxID=2636026 RepID=UPI0026E125D7|nr:MULTISPECIES: hypothetical protein [unclassified Agarivorans]MDO6686128.1 hypothetical protein [Agarivorans sp. 3_MG-2023]MDO6716423.1 hypothetical protein [Agarivorans sp. 2_MG-2023]